MTGSTLAHDAPALLLLSRNAGWTDSVRREAARLPVARLLTVSDARDAVALLCCGERFSHLLMHPPAADGLLPDLIGLTTGEAESGIATILLGKDGAAARCLPGGGRATVVPRPSEGWLGPALQQAAASPPEPVPLPLDDLLGSLAAGRLQTRYQPVVRLADGMPLGLEALARLEHPQLGTLAPDRFVPQIEAAGFAARLAELVARRAFAQWGGDALLRLELRLAVNLPLDVLLLPGAAARLEAWRVEAGIDPGRLVVELTETHPIGRPDTLRPVLTGLREAGYGLAIDDVGPDLRDYNEIVGLPFTTMKLDKAVVQDSAASAAARRFLEGAIATAQAAGMLVIAEGIEDHDDWSRMAALGVHAGQGFLIARPLTAAAVGIWHASWPRRPVAGAPPRTPPCAERAFGTTGFASWTSSRG
jgi:EAL domain-containing protein (putative c-di-GMP-specific phosphodiesterase class I)